MKTSIVSILAFLGSAAAFAPLAPRVLRTAVVSNSHFSTVATQLKDKDLLISALQDNGVEVVVAETTQAVRGYQGSTVQAEIVIPQSNGQDIGFSFNGDSFEMVADLQFWGQQLPVESFLEKLTQRYSVNAVLESAQTGGFSQDLFVENKQDGTIEIELSRYVM
mmetsp:Transcript_48654/g.97878  ORF Transcript_48654/g.97878 Transcript_48654/m.97878 type:complete len:164 (-) Transcript_48654:202-693(-)